MRAISLWQPWASAIALRKKTIETRSWSTPHRGPIAIHAAQRWTEQQRQIGVEKGLLPEHWPGDRWTLHNGILPLGYIVAVTEILYVKTIPEILPALTREEYLWGNYSPGRFAWILGRVHALKQPVRAKGRQGMFTIANELIPDAPSWAVI